MLHIIPINDDHRNFHDFMAMVVLNQPQFSFNIALKWVVGDEIDINKLENLLPDPVSIFLSIPVLSWAEVAFAIIVKSIASGIKLTAHFWTRMQSPKRTQSIPMSTSFIMIATKIIIVKLTTRFWIRMQSQSGSIHSPHRIRNIIMKLWKKSVKFHLKKEKFQKCLSHKCCDQDCEDSKCND